MLHLPAKERIEKYNSDISEMIDKLAKFHKKNTKFLNNYKGSHEKYTGGVYHYAEKLEEVLLATGTIAEEDSKYQ